MKTIQLLAFIILFPIIGYCQDLIETIKTGDFQNATLLLNSQAINQADENGATPLMWAVYKGNLELSRYLVKNGAELKINGVIYLDPEKQSYYGSLTGIAAGEGNLEMLRYLIDELEIDVDEMEFDPSTYEATGWTALHWAAYKGYPDITEYLINNHADINKINISDGCTPIIYAAVNKNYDVTNSLLNSGANSDVVNNYGFAALHYVSWKCCWEQIEWFVEKGGNINILSRDGFTPLMYIQAYCSEVNDSVITNLLEKGAIVDNDLVNSFYYRDQQFKTFYNANDYEKALYYGLEAMKCAKIEFGLLHPKYAISLNNIGAVFSIIGDYHTANEYFFEAIEVHLQLSEPDLIEFAKTINNICINNIQLGNYEEASELYLAHSDVFIQLITNKSTVHIDIIITFLSELSKIIKFNEINNKNYEKLDIYELFICTHKSLLGDIYNKFGNQLTSTSILNPITGNYNLTSSQNNNDLDFIKELFGNSKFSENHSQYLISLTNLGLFYHKSKSYYNALVLYNIAIFIYDTLELQATDGYINTLAQIAEIYRIIGEHQAAKYFNNHAIKIIDNNYLNKHHLFYIILNNLALTYQELGEYDSAIQFYYQAIHYTEKESLKCKPIYGTSLHNLATVYQIVGIQDSSIRYYSKSMEIARACHGYNSPIYLKRLDNLAKAYKSKSDYAKASGLFMQKLELIEEYYQEDMMLYIKTLNELGGVYLNLCQYDRSLNFFERALSNLLSHFDTEHPDYPTILNNIAGLYSLIGKYEDALQSYHRLLIHVRNSFAIEQFDYDNYLNNIAGVYFRLGDYNNAIFYFTESLKETEMKRGKEHHEYGVRLNNLGVLYQTLGQHEKAQTCYIEAYNNTVQRFGKDHIASYTTQTNIAKLHSESGNEDIALELFIEICENVEKSVGKYHEAYVFCLNDMALSYQKMGYHDRAFDLYIEVLDITDSIFGRHHPHYNTFLHNLATLCQDMEYFDYALKFMLQALDLSEKNLGSEHPSLGNSLNSLAILCWEMGQDVKSLNFFQQAIENNFTNLGQVFAFLSESEKENFTKTIEPNFKAYQSFFLQYETQQPGVAGDAFNVELATKGMILNSGIQMRQAIAGSRDTVAMANFDEWLKNRNILAMQYSLPIVERRRDLAEFEEKTNRLESELSRVSTTFSQQVSIGQLRWQHLQEQIKEGESAIEFSSFNYHDGKRWTDSTFYCALVITKHSEYPHMLFLFEENDLYDALPEPTHSSYWEYNLVYQGARASGTVFFEQETHTGDKLYELVWKPIDSLLQDKGIETIYFAPSGLLHTVSFAAIPTPDGELLMEKYNLVQLGSTRTVALQQEPVELKNAVVFGGIDYDLEGEELELIAQQFRENENFAFQYMPYRDIDTRYGGFTYLEGSLVEAKKVSALLSENISTTKITGRDAIEESFKALSGSHAPSVIHIATHGFYFPDNISDKRREQMMFAAIGEERFRISDDPLMRSALVMAGANHAWKGKTLPPGVQDGILTARDVSAMNLANTELVVLSACQTGLGDVKGSEGVTGLQRAFKMAGVRYIIMSLWPVPDKETVEFMEAFYGNWLGGMEIRTAFTATQKQMHERYPNEPFKWAAFVLME